MIRGIINLFARLFRRRVGADVTVRADFRTIHVRVTAGLRKTFNLDIERINQVLSKLDMVDDGGGVTSARIRYVPDPDRIALMLRHLGKEQQFYVKVERLNKALDGLGL